MPTCRRKSSNGSRASFRRRRKEWSYSVTSALQARSSRNTYLSAEEKARAVAISATLAAVKSGKIKTLAAAAKAIEKAGLRVDYVECVDAETLEPRRRIEKGSCVLVAAFCGKTRLIDNVLV